MKGRLAFAALLVAALWIWERSLVGTERERRAAGPRIGRLVPTAEREGRVVAALKVETGAGERFFYASYQGTWRCASWLDAPASGQRIQGLLAKLFDAEGMIVDPEGTRAKEYGLDGPDAIALDYLGPKGEAVFGFELGHASADGEGCFVRRAGEAKVWSVDTNPRVELDRSAAPGRPPLLDPNVVPAWWPGASRVVRSIRVERAGEVPYAVDMAQREISPEELGAGASPYSWTVAREGVTETAPPALGMGFSLFLLRSPWKDLLAPEEAGKLDVSRPEAVVVATPVEGAEMRLWLVRRADGVPVVVCSVTGLAYVVVPEVAELLFPRVELLAPTAETNPWDPWLRR